MYKSFFVCLFISFTLFSQEKILYKSVNDVDLHLYRYPTKLTKSKNYPAMVFFFGGGWTKGSHKQFTPHAKYFSQRGFNCFLVEYRVSSRHNSTPFESLQDAKTAIRFIRKNANKYGINSNKIVAVGASAGGQLAAASALVKKYNEKTDDKEISSKPNVLVLFNPAIDNGPGGVGYHRVKNDYKNFSPLHSIKKGAPPTIILSGTKDELILVKTLEKYTSLMKKVGSRCELFLYKDKKHGFFNYRKFENFKSTILTVDRFLQSLNYLDKEPIIQVK